MKKKCKTKRKHRVGKTKNITGHSRSYRSFAASTTGQRANKTRRPQPGGMR